VTTPRPLLWSAYAGVSHLITPLAKPFLAKRLARGKEDAARLGERLGKASLTRPEGRLVWVHAASVGETVSVLPLIGEMVKSGTVLLTTGTVTSAELAAKRLPQGAIHQFVPLDLASATARFLDHWRPDLAILTESELWPNLMFGCFSRDIPLGIVNGRMSERSHRGWKRLSGPVRGLLAPLAFCLAQSDADAQRYADLGAPAISLGNLKFDVPPLPFDAAERDALRDAITPRPVFVAASTHPGEEEAVIMAAMEARARLPDLLTIIVPRHPERGAQIAALAESGGLIAPRRSLGAHPDALDTLYIADTLGELGLFYALADLAFIGGSLVEVGGHNAIEAVKLGVPVLSGPHVKNFTHLFNVLGQAQAYREVADQAALAAELVALLSNPAARAQLAANASAAMTSHEGALARSLGHLSKWLGPQ
jgi:3-deoxy-D-manno-octulosonic-acid transferase